MPTIPSNPRVPKITATVFGKWWVWDKYCAGQYTWYSGPFNTQQDAVNFINNSGIVGGTSCPGCGRGTPASGDYNIGQM